MGKSSADERFCCGVDSKVANAVRSAAIPAASAAGLAGYIGYKYIRNRSVPKETRSTGEQAYDVFKQWSQVEPMERYRPPPIKDAHLSHASRTYLHSTTSLHMPADRPNTGLTHHILYSNRDEL